jgi:hypothetical protein
MSAWRRWERTKLVADVAQSQAAGALDGILSRHTRPRLTAPL